MWLSAALLACVGLQRYGLANYSHNCPAENIIIVTHLIHIKENSKKIEIELEMNLICVYN